MAGVTRDPAYIAELMDFLSNEGYCNGDATCISFLDPYVPLAAEQLAVVLETDTTRLCNEVYNLGC